MKPIDVLKLFVIGFLAPFTYQYLNNLFGEIPVSIEKWSEISLYVVMALFTLWKGRKYRQFYLLKKKTDHMQI